MSEYKYYYLYDPIDSIVLLEALAAREIEFTAHAFSKAIPPERLEKHLWSKGLRELPTLMQRPGDVRYEGLEQIKEFLDTLEFRKNPRVFVQVPLGRMPGFDDPPPTD